MSRALAYLVAMLMMLFCSSALAQQPMLSVQLEVGPKETPDQVCILFERATAFDPRTDFNVATFIGKTYDTMGKVVLARIDMGPVPDPKEPAKGRFDPKSRPEFVAALGIEQEKADGIYSVSELHAQRKQKQRGAQCAEGPTACHPSINWDRVTEGWFLRCAKNTQSSSPRAAEPRVLVMELKITGTAKTNVRDVLLQGNQVTMVLESALANHTATMLVRGGHYDHGASSGYNLAGLLQLPITARCVDRDLPIPIQGDSRSWIREVTISGPPDEVCYDDSRDSIRMRVPRGTAGLTKTLSVKVCDASQPACPSSAVAYRGRVSWPGADPPERLVLSDELVRFNWAADPCLYKMNGTPEGCPEARVASGAECERIDVNERDECVYQCEAPKNLEGFSLPLDVRFTVGKHRDAWRASVANPDAVITEYAERDKRQFFVDFDQWQGSTWAPRERFEGRRGQEGFGIEGDRIDYVEIVAPDGTLHRVVPGESQRVNVPGVACQDILQYRIRGNQLHSDGYVRLEDGELALPHPALTMDLFNWGGYVGGGLATDLSLSTPVGVAGTSIRLRPNGPWRLTDFSMELQALTQFGAFVYRGVDYQSSALSQETGETVREPYFRIWGAFAMDFAITDHLRGGAALGGGAGMAFLAQHIERFGGPTPLFVPAIFVRDQIDPRFILEANARLMGPQLERNYVLSARGNPTAEDIHIWLLAIDLGMRFWL